MAEILSPYDIHPALGPLIKELKNLGARDVILYGSRARGDHHPRADIDLAVRLSTGLNSRKWQNMKEKTQEARTLLEISLVDLGKTKGTLKANILKRREKFLR